MNQGLKGFPRRLPKPSSGGGITSVNGDTGPIVVLDTDDIAEGVVNLYALYNKTDFVAQTSVNVVHNFGRYPSTTVTNASGVVRIPLSITHNTQNDVTVTFSVSTTGSIILNA